MKYDGYRKFVPRGSYIEQLVMLTFPALRSNIMLAAVFWPIGQNTVVNRRLLFLVAAAAGGPFSALEKWSKEADVGIGNNLFWAII